MTSQCLCSLFWAEGEVVVAVQVVFEGPEFETKEKLDLLHKDWRQF